MTGEEKKTFLQNLAIIESISSAWYCLYKCHAIAMEVLERTINRYGIYEYVEISKSPSILLLRIKLMKKRGCFEINAQLLLILCLI